MTTKLPCTALAERDPAAHAAEDQVVDEAHADELATFGEASGEGEILRRGARVARGMGVEDDHAAGAVQQTLLEDRPRLDRGPIHGAAVELALGDEAVARVEIERAHDLLVTHAVAQREVA